LDNNNSLQVLKLKYQILTDAGLSDEGERTLARIRELEPSFQKATGGKSLVVLIPNKLKPYIEKAEDLRKKGQLAEAVSVLMEANTIREIPYTNLLIGKLLFSQKKIEAVEYLEKAKKEMKGDPSLEYCLSVLYLIKRDFQSARSAVDEFAKIQGENNPQTVQLRTLLQQTVAGNKNNREK